MTKHTTYANFRILSQKIPYSESYFIVNQFPVSKLGKKYRFNNRVMWHAL